MTKDYGHSKMLLEKRRMPNLYPTILCNCYLEMGLYLHKNVFTLLTIGAIVKGNYIFFNDWHYKNLFTEHGKFEHNQLVKNTNNCNSKSLILETKRSRVVNNYTHLHCPSKDILTWLKWNMKCSISCWCHCCQRKKWWF